MYEGERLCVRGGANEECCFWLCWPVPSDSVLILDLLNTHSANRCLALTQPVNLRIRVERAHCNLNMSLGRLSHP